MIERILLVVATAALAACPRADRRPDATDLPGPDQLVLAPDDAASPITATTTEAELRDRFGATQVRRTQVHVGEGQTEPGTALFPDDPRRRAEVLWHDAQRTYPSRVLIRGRESVWTIPPGISLGVALDSLERINVGPFRLTGFGWDYEGTVIDWEGGALEDLFAPDARLLLRLGLAEDEGLDEQDMRAVGGEAAVPSSHPVMRRINPRVYEMVVIFEEQETRPDGRSLVQRELHDVVARSAATKQSSRP